MPDFSWSERAGRLRDNTGRFVPESRIRDGVDVLVDAASQRAMKLAQDLREERITISQFRDGMFAMIKDVHVASALAAYGGKNAMDPSKYGYTGHLIKQQYQYARGMLSDIIDGKQPLNGRLDQRAVMYAEAGRVTYETVRLREQKKRGITQVRNQVHAKESCDECKKLTAAGWVDVDEMIPIGGRECRSRCRCTLEMRGQQRTAPVEQKPDVVDVPPELTTEDMIRATEARLKERGVDIQYGGRGPDGQVDIPNRDDVLMPLVEYEKALKSFADYGVKVGQTYRDTTTGRDSKFGTRIRIEDSADDQYGESMGGGLIRVNVRNRDAAETIMEASKHSYETGSFPTYAFTSTEEVWIHELSHQIHRSLSKEDESSWRTKWKTQDDENFIKGPSGYGMENDLEGFAESVLRVIKKRPFDSPMYDEAQRLLKQFAESGQ